MLFQVIGRAVDRRLEELGAVRVCERYVFAIASFLLIILVTIIKTIRYIFTLLKTFIAIIVRNTTCCHYCASYCYHRGRGEGDDSEDIEEDFDEWSHGVFWKAMELSETVRKKQE